MAPLVLAVSLLVLLLRSALANVRLHACASRVVMSRIDAQAAAGGALVSGV